MLNHLLVMAALGLLSFAHASGVCAAEPTGSGPTSSDPVIAIETLSDLQQQPLTEDVGRQIISLVYQTNTDNMERLQPLVTDETSLNFQMDFGFWYPPLEFTLSTAELQGFPLPLNGELSMILSAMADSDSKGSTEAASSSQTEDYQPLKRKHRIRKVVADSTGATITARVRETYLFGGTNGSMMSEETFRLEKVGQHTKLVDYSSNQRWHW